MDEMKTLADQLRSQMKQPGEPQENHSPVNNSAQSPEAPTKDPTILELLRAFDNSDHKSMVHVRFDAKTLRTMNQFKMATGVDVTKLVAYSVRQLFALHPELKTIIKQFIQNIDLWTGYNFSPML